MKRFQGGALLVLITLILWGLALGPPAQVEGDAKGPEQQGAQGPERLPPESAPEPEAGEASEPDEGIQPPGREDPERFYRKPPRKPRELRQVNA